MSNETGVKIGKIHEVYGKSNAVEALSPIRAFNQLSPADRVAACAAFVVDRMSMEKKHA